jgi:hypothetical protein
VAGDFAQDSKDGARHVHRVYGVVWFVGFFLVYHTIRLAGGLVEGGSGNQVYHLKEIIEIIYKFGLFPLLFRAV